MSPCNRVNSSGMASRLVVAVMLSLGLCAFSAVARNSPPLWTMPVPGTAAFLGENGGRPGIATVCDTAAKFRARDRGEHPAGCKRFPHGLVVVIDGLRYDPGSLFAGGNSMPLVKIHIPSRRFTGYVALENGIHPRILPGTVMRVQTTGDLTFRLASSQEALSGAGPKLRHATIKVLRQDPATGYRDLYIMVTSGKDAGKRGWLFSQLVNGSDGIPVNQFMYAILSPHESIPSAYLIQKSPPTMSAALNRQRSVPPFGVPRGRPDFQHFVDYYARGSYAAGAAVHCGLRSEDWGRRVMREALRLLFLRSTYDYPLETPGEAGTLKSADQQLAAAVKAGLHAPLSACAKLRGSPDYFLAGSLASFAAEKR